MPRSFERRQLACLCAAGVGACVRGSGPATFTVAWWRSGLLGYIRMCAAARCLCLSGRAGLGACLYSSRLRVYAWCGCFVNTRCCNIRSCSCWRAVAVGWLSYASPPTVAGRAVSVKPVPYAPGPSSPRRVARGSCVWLPSTMTKIVYFSQPSA